VGGGKEEEEDEEEEEEEEEGSDSSCSSSSDEEEEEEEEEESDTGISRTKKNSKPKPHTHTHPFPPSPITTTITSTGERLPSFAHYDIHLFHPDLDATFVSFFATGTGAHSFITRSIYYSVVRGIFSQLQIHTHTHTHTVEDRGGVCSVFEGAGGDAAVLFVVDDAE
jgi:hypothetical protein